MNKVFKVPNVLVKPPYNYNCLELGGCAIREACSLVSSQTGSMFLEDHLLLVVLQGSYTIRYNNQEHQLQSNQMVVLKKAIAVEYTKTGNAGVCEYMMFFLKDDLLKEFALMSERGVKTMKEMTPISIKSISPPFSAFIASLKPHLKSSDAVDKGLIKVKMLESLYGLAAMDENLMLQILQLTKQVRSSITTVKESNYLNPVSVTDLAYLSGRSLSAFKRDFRAIYNTSPSKWLRERKLLKAKALLMTTSMSITDICYGTGFENVAHFSRVFKKFHGLSPSVVKHDQWTKRNKSLAQME